MAKLYDVREIAMPAEEFFRLQNDAAYEALQARLVHFARYDETSRTPLPDGGFRRIIHQEPATKAPKAIEMFIKSGLGGKNFFLTETRDVPAQGLTYRWKIDPPAFADRVSIAGEFRVEPIGAKRCRRIIDGEFSVRLTGLGAMLAKFAAKEVARGYDTVPRVAEAWVRGER